MSGEFSKSVDKAAEIVKKALIAIVISLKSSPDSITACRLAYINDVLATFLKKLEEARFDDPQRYPRMLEDSIEEVYGKYAALLGESVVRVIGALGEDPLGSYRRTILSHIAAVGRSIAEGPEGTRELSAAALSESGARIRGRYEEVIGFLGTLHAGEPRVFVDSAEGLEELAEAAIERISGVMSRGRGDKGARQEVPRDRAKNYGNGREARDRGRKARTRAPGARRSGLPLGPAKVLRDLP